MLVLSRKQTERIHIGDDITLEVRRIAGNRVTLAIDAPRDIRILRGELENAAKEFEPEPKKEPEPTGDGPSTYLVSRHRSPRRMMAAATPDSTDHGLAAYVG